MKLSIKLQIDTDNLEDRNTIETVIELCNDIKEALENNKPRGTKR